MLKWILGLVVLAVVTVLVLAGGKPDAFRIERRIRINAPPERVYDEIVDFRRWKGWSPWEKKDPAMQATYGGPASGEGARYAWSGNGNVGVGSMEIEEAVPPTRIRIRLDFVKPMEGHNEAVFTLEPISGGTQVNWVMTGRNNLASKVMQVFMNLDRMVGDDFEAGLAALKALAEGGAGQPAA